MTQIYDHKPAQNEEQSSLESQIEEHRAKMRAAAREKAQHGELRLNTPVGYIWARNVGVTFDPNARVQSCIGRILERFRELSSAKEVWRSLRDEHVKFPSYRPGGKERYLSWGPLKYFNVISVLKSPFYAGAYRYGKKDGHSSDDSRTEVEIGRGPILIKDHHPGYLSWEEYERNQALLASNVFNKSKKKSSRVHVIRPLTGLITCGQCRSHLGAFKVKKSYVYSCENCAELRSKDRSSVLKCVQLENLIFDQMIKNFGPEIAAKGLAPRALGQMILDDGSDEALPSVSKSGDTFFVEQPNRTNDLYPSSSGRPSNSKSLGSSLGSRGLEAKMSAEHGNAKRLSDRQKSEIAQSGVKFSGAAKYISRNATKKLVSIYLERVVFEQNASNDEESINIYWKNRTRMRIDISKSPIVNIGSDSRTSEQALDLIREAGTTLPSSEIAALLNTQGIKTARGGSWTDEGVRSVRQAHGIPAYRSAEKDSGWLTMRDAAACLGVSTHKIRQMIKLGILPSEQVTPGAPLQIRSSHLLSSEVREAVVSRTHRVGMPTFQPPSSKLKSKY